MNISEKTKKQILSVRYGRNVLVLHSQDGYHHHHLHLHPASGSQLITQLQFLHLSSVRLEAQCVNSSLMLSFIIRYTTTVITSHVCKITNSCFPCSYHSSHFARLRDSGLFAPPPCLKVKPSTAAWTVSQTIYDM